MKCEDGINRELELTMAVVMQPNQANLAGNVHGGEIMKLMDNVAGATVIQFTKENTVTARVDELEFMEPINIGAFVTCTGKIAYVGNTSVEVVVTVDVEHLRSHDPKFRALTAFFTMVSLDENGKPKKVPGIIPETNEEVRIYNDVMERRAKFRKRQNK